MDLDNPLYCRQPAHLTDVITALTSVKYVGYEDTGKTKSHSFTRIIVERDFRVQMS